MNDITLYNPDTQLSEEQIAIAPLLIAGVPVKYIAKKFSLPAARINAWQNTDRIFISYLEMLREERNKILDDSMLKIGALALLHAEDILTTDIEPEDFTGRKIKADLAKSVMAMISSKKVDVKIQAPSAQLNNIDQSSLDIVNKHGRNKDNYIVINNAEIPVDEPLLYHECVMGTLNTDTSSGKIQCHVCGGWYDDFVKHIRLAHSISPARYRIVYQIPDDIPFFLESEYKEEV